MSRTGVPSSASINGTGDACGGIDAENRNRRERDRVRPDRRPGGGDPEVVGLGEPVDVLQDRKADPLPAVLGVQEVEPAEGELVGVDHDRERADQAAVEDHREECLRVDRDPDFAFVIGKL